MSTTSAPLSTPLTLDDYRSLQEPDDVRSELVRGRLVREPRPGYRHGRIQADLAWRLRDFVEERGLGVVLTDIGVLLERQPPTVRGPDLAFFSSERAPSGDPPGFVETAPDLVVEVVSPNDRATALMERVLAFLDAGVEEAWVVEPEARTITVYRSRGEIRIVAAGETLEARGALEGFSLRPEELFPV